MAAEVINQVLEELEGQIAGDILRRPTVFSPWVNWMQTGLWPEGMGHSLSVLTVGRSLPTTDAGAITGGTWTDIGTANFGAAGSNCLPTAVNLKGGTTKEEYNLQHAAIQGDRFCVNDLRASYMRPKQLEKIKQNLADATKFVMIERARDEFSRVCNQHFLVTSAGIESGTTMPTGAGKTPAKLTRDFLIDRYEYQASIGAGESPLITRQDGAPIFNFVTSLGVSGKLKQASGTRDDYRWNPAMVGELLKVYSAFGALSAAVDGYQHIIDVNPPRWEYSGGWVRVWPKRLVVGDTGYVLEENPNYHTAAWEDSFLFHPDVAKLLYPTTITDAGGGVSFQPVQYRGEWKWENIKFNDPTSAAHNPDGTIGRYRAVFATGTEPLYPDFGFRVRHSRCRNITEQYAACS